MCMNFGGFTFNSDEYFQHSGLAMGSPLSPVAACLYMEWLEKHHYLGIMGSNVIWARYVDDILVVVPNDMNLETKLNELNSVDPKIQFTIEKEHQRTLAFLDTEIVRNAEVKFKVYRKPTNKECYVHYYSGHSDRVKRGVVLGFFLRAFRICSDEYLQEEIEHIMTSFTKLKYPRGFLINMKKKALDIRKRSAKSNKKEQIRCVTIPYSKSAEIIANKLEETGCKVAFCSGKKVSSILTKKESSDDPEPKSVVYQVPCGSCTKSYIGETGRGLKTRLKEHRRDLRNNSEFSAFVIHSMKTNHLPNWDRARIIAVCKNKDNRKATEAAHIANNDTFNLRPGFMKWAKSAAVLGVG